MSLPHVHYEAAFADFIRSRGWPVVTVNEQRKAIFGGERVKSFDFVVRPPGSLAWLVDVKGRKFPYDTEGGFRYWENWVTREDLDGLQRWTNAFGNGFEPVFVFAYWLIGLPKYEPSSAIHAYRDELYAFLWISASTYAEHARSRSTSWDTLSVPCAIFRRMARPVTEEGVARNSERFTPVMQGI